MARSYLTGEMRSLGFGKRVVQGPQRDWRGQSDFKRRSLPEKPHFVKADRAWDDYRSVFDPVRMRELIKTSRSRRAGGPLATSKARADQREWVKQFGLRRKLRNAMANTAMRAKVACRLAVSAQAKRVAA